jgi:hypothetical protein
LTSQEKTKFRNTKQWKNFCKTLKEKRGLKCECCYSNSKRLQVHHIKPAEYTNLIEENFSLVCFSCHKNISKLERIKKENYSKYRKEWLSCYLPFIEKDK